MKKATGLGRGLSALLDEAVRTPRAPSDAHEIQRGGVREIELALIRPNPNQPRKAFDEVALDELASSIAEKGVLQPILLPPAGVGFEIIAGQRRSPALSSYPSPAGRTRIGWSTPLSAIELASSPSATSSNALRG